MALQEEREPPLLALLEWEARTDRWLAFPAAAREGLVTELARLMIRVAGAEAADERDGPDHPGSS